MSTPVSRGRPGRDLLQPSVRRDDALHEHLVVSEQAVPGRVEPPRAKRSLRRREQPGMRRRVDVGPVEDGAGITRDLRSTDARRSAGGWTIPPRNTARPHASSLAWALSARSPVSTTLSGCSASIACTAPSSTWSVSASCGRNVDANGPPRRSRKGARAGDFTSRTCAPVSCAQVARTRIGGPPASRRVSPDAGNGLHARPAPTHAEAIAAIAAEIPRTAARWAGVTTPAPARRARERHVPPPLRRR